MVTRIRNNSIYRIHGARNFGPANRVTRRLAPGNRGKITVRGSVARDAFPSLVVFTASCCLFSRKRRITGRKESLTEEVYTGREGGSDGKARRVRTGLPSIRVQVQGHWSIVRRCLELAFHRGRLPMAFRSKSRPRSRPGVVSSPSSGIALNIKLYVL